MTERDNGHSPVSPFDEIELVRQPPWLESMHALDLTMPNALARLGLEKNAFPSVITEDQLRQALTDPAWSVRIAAVQALGKRGKLTTLEPLVNALGDENGFVRAAAARALGVLQQEVPVDRLIMALQDT